jgi:hypothetical protein
VHNAVVVEVRDRRKRGPNEIRGIRLVVLPFAADAIEELAPKCEISYEVNCNPPISMVC